MSKTFILGICVLAMSISCGEQRGAVKENSPENSGEALAVVSGENITTGDIERELARLPYRQRKLYTSSPERLNEYLEAYINKKVLYNEAVRRGIPEDPEILRKTEDYKRKLVREALGRAIVAEIKENEEGLRRYYRENGKLYEELNVSGIVIPNGSGNQHADKEALLNAELVSGKAEEGKSPEATATELGIVYENPVNDTITRQSYAPDISERIFSLSEGETSDPLEVDNGYLIIKVEEKMGIPPYERISKKTKAQLEQGMLKEYINSLRDQQGVTVYNIEKQEIL